MANLITLTIFLGLGAGFVLFNLLVGKLARPYLPTHEKQTTYECGELPIGSSWVQFDLRFYIIALIFLVFDVEIALFYPWATVFHEFKLAALIDLLVFFGVLLAGYVYLWRFGYLEWVRANVATHHRKTASGMTDEQLREHSRKDPENVEA